MKVERQLPKRLAPGRSRTGPSRVALSGLVLACVCLAASGTAAGAAGHGLQSFDLVVPQPPTPVTVLGEENLVYELHLSSFAPVDLMITGIEVLDGSRPGGLVATFDGPEVAELLGGPGVRDEEGTGTAVIAPGTRAVAYFWLALDSSRGMPGSVAHRIIFREAPAIDGPATAEVDEGEGAGTGGDPAGSADGNAARSAGGTVTDRGDGALESSAAGDRRTEFDQVEGGHAEVLDASPPVLGSPLRGGPWVAVYDPAAGRGHRRVLLALDGRVRIPARFAVDWMLADGQGRFGRGDASSVESWYGYGADVLAVADARVAAVRNSIPESPTIPSVPHELEEASGNYVTLDLGDGRYVHYEHLLPGSVRVVAGDRVRQGDVVARVGYSGDSVAPHLHMHVSDGATPLAGEGIPWEIRDFDSLGSYATLPSVTSFAEGVRWQPAPPGAPATRSRELPGALAVVAFPAGPGAPR